MRTEYVEDYMGTRMSLAGFSTIATEKWLRKLSERGYVDPKIEIEGEINGTMYVKVRAYTTAYDSVGRWFKFPWDCYVERRLFAVAERVNNLVNSLPPEDEERKNAAYRELAKAIDGVKTFGHDVIDDEARIYAENLLRAVSKNLLTHVHDTSVHDTNVTNDEE